MNNKKIWVVAAAGLAATLWFLLGKRKKREPEVTVSDKKHRKSKQGKKKHQALANGATH